jgi:hypothetical protein
MLWLGTFVTVIVEALVSFFVNGFLVKAMLGVAVYAFIFTIIPLLIYFLVPTDIQNAFLNYQNMLKGNIWGENLAYIWLWLHLFTLMEIVLTALAVRFLFRRI